MRHIIRNFMLGAALAAIAMPGSSQQKGVGLSAVPVIPNTAAETLDRLPTGIYYSIETNQMVVLQQKTDTSYPNLGETLLLVDLPYPTAITCTVKQLGESQFEYSYRLPRKSRADSPANLALLVPWKSVEHVGPSLSKTYPSDLVDRHVPTGEPLSFVHIQTLGEVRETPSGQSELRFVSAYSPGYVSVVPDLQNVKDLERDLPSELFVQLKRAIQVYFAQRQHTVVGPRFRQSVDTRTRAAVLGTSVEKIRSSQISAPSPYLDSMILALQQVVELGADVLPGERYQPFLRIAHTPASETEIEIALVVELSLLSETTGF